jgi:L-ascorbate metabolism protein UlaG (beta-lactamase superfamily)
MTSLALDRAAMHRLLDRRALRRDRMARAPNWKDGKFWNPGGADAVIGFGKTIEVARLFWSSRGAARTPPAALPLVSPLPAWRERSRTGLRATWLGHSTVLLEVDGARVLTDPVFSLRASPTELAGPRRFHAPPVRIEELPPLDAIVLSHDHYDHLDAAAIEALARTQAAPIFTPLGVGGHLERLGVPEARIVELAWWEEAEVPGTALRVAATPAQHFSGRSPLDRNATLWASFVVRGPRHRVFFSGDTGLEPELPRIAERFGPFDLVMLEVGAFHPLWGAIHLGPHQAMTALERLGGAAFLPVHWSTFDLGLHAWDEPILPLEEAADEGAIALLSPVLGEARDVEDRDDVRRAFAGARRWWREVG